MTCVNVESRKGYKGPGTVVKSDERPNQSKKPTVSEILHGSRAAPRINPTTRNINKILPHLYLGNMLAAGNEMIMKEHKIQRVLSITTTIPTDFKNITYKRFTVADVASSDLLPLLSEALPFIHQGIENKQTTFVHCQVGKSRSAFFVLAYLMKYHNMRLSTALAFVREKRPVVNPNPGFMKQLQQLDTQWNSEQSGPTPAPDELERPTQ
eukprot:TRINITY_DN32680_c0_g1_i1.p1 TRINITY_DN32680_c0_g1~~TRINITY_DN32680_c0_g1_i1.p1  ORF type:complete len:210 (-),score=19.86 TRINITY_DN32680_c0_g1_i1:103-732(-)